MSDTPRTDTVAFGTNNESLNRLFWIRELPRYVAPADFARQLERELAAVTAERDATHKEVELVIGFQDREADAKRKALADLANSQQEVWRLREALEWAMSAVNPSPCRCISFVEPPHICIGHTALASTPAPVHPDTERLKALLSTIQQDYNHPWPDEDAGTKAHRVSTLAAIDSAIKRKDSSHE